MCIPCVMCGACVDPGDEAALSEGRCPECGELVPDDAMSCPNCYVLLRRSSAVLPLD